MPPRKAAPRLAEVPAVDRNSGEIMQLELLNDEVLQNLANRPPPASARYDWRPHTGRHINVPKALIRAIWHKDSGYDRNDRDVLGFFLGHCPEGGTEPLRMTYKEISNTLGMRQDAVRKSVEKLHRGNILVLVEAVGRVKFFKVNPRAAFDGPATAQNEATQETRFPEVPPPAKAQPERSKKREAS